MISAMWQISSVHRRSLGPSWALVRFPLRLKSINGTSSNWGPQHWHWTSYFHKYGVLADAPYSKFHTKEDWDTWDSLEEHEPVLTNTYGKKVTKPFLMVVVAPTTTEIGDDYFLNKLHEPACIKRKSVYYGTKVAGKRSHVQVVICPYCGVLSQNALSGCSHIWRHFGLTLHVEVVGGSAWKLPRSSKSTLENVQRH